MLHMRLMNALHVSLCIIKKRQGDLSTGTYSSRVDHHGHPAPAGLTKVKNLKNRNPGSGFWMMVRSSACRREEDKILVREIVRAALFNYRKITAWC
jgi:hypothetical protein